MGASALDRLLAATGERLDRRFRWSRLPLPVALLALIGLRKGLQAHNLYDTGSAPATGIPSPPEGHRGSRSADGSWNDVASPGMGRAGARFGRNVPIDSAWPAAEPTILTPSPRTVSRELLTRTALVPATTLNVLAAAWLQFQIHDWFSHGSNDKTNPWVLPLATDDPWPEHPMRIPRTRPDPDSPAGAPPTYLNTETHWWDASQIYGSDEGFQQKIRTGIEGKLALGTDGLLPLDPSQLGDVVGVAGNWWLGLSMLHVLFMREHNAICDRLRRDHPGWGDEELFSHARLVNAALLAKIHTVEWTPAILGHPALQIGMRANWWGIAGERVSRLVGRISDSETVSGIPGGPTRQYDVPYAMTEEFVAVYRMHPLLPDDFDFRSVRDDALVAQLSFPEIAGPRANPMLEQLTMQDALYSFGIAHPGAITLHNYPRFLQQLQRSDGSLLDLAAVDILRSRERGVPRYNEFRRLLRMRPASSFEHLAARPEWAAELRAVYGDVEQVDLTVGMYAERLPDGFGFSDTAFRIFVLMASRRLEADRFFTVDFTPEVYTPAGLAWIADNDMSSVLLRHYPDLGPALAGRRNAFAPWQRTGAVSPEPRP